MKSKNIILLILIAVLILTIMIPKPKTATDIMKEQARAGSTEAQILTGQVYTEKGKHKQAAKWFEKAALQGDKYAYRLLLGLYLENGNKADYCALQIVVEQINCEYDDPSITKKIQKRVKTLKNKQSADN